jgi:hypothetical protein
LLNVAGTNVRPSRWLREQQSLTGYCVSTNCHPHGVGTDNKNNPVERRSSPFGSVAASGSRC